VRFPAAPDIVSSAAPAAPSSWDRRGKFDALFLADVLGVYDVYRGSHDAAIANAVQVPVNDPLLLIPAMAYVTRNLGFGVTCAVSSSPR
jgi:alkanesulfonate monooxygenase SsuD/methylene tetrahydromethanopterin reductase-like flavin-dependent oxidoreductase (luciferase family)